MSAPEKPDKPLGELTVLELTRLVSAQDDRWADVLTYVQSTRHPGAPAGMHFFKTNWRPVMTSYFENVAARYDAAARVPIPVVTWLLDLLSTRVYPGARAVGFSDRTFLFPDITLEQSGHPAIPPSPTTVAVRGSATPAQDSTGRRVLRYVGIGGLLLLAGIPLVKIVKEHREAKRSDAVWKQQEGLWKRAHPDLPWWPEDVNAEKQSKWLAARQQWEKTYPGLHLPWRGRLGIGRG